MTETGTLTLTEFLLARIAEDEAIAKSTSLHFDAHLAGWAVATGAAVTFNGLPHARIAQAAGSSPGQVAEHIARHDPARVLAECEAKRRTVAAFEDERVRRDIYNKGYDEGRLTTDDDLRNRLASNAHCRGLEIAMEAHASVYAVHPDYRQEWKP